ncbi:MAG: TSUP family transporter [Treponema sp.]|jgi:uncharacterized membrane protein YfcA|nr:TSUP family transporter [Treponema sp.]
MMTAMELSAPVFFIVCPLVFLAGFVDSIAGGGGLISLPAYVAAGIPIHYALGTNKCSSAVGTITASFRYYRSGYVDMPLCAPSIAAALAGSALGASLTLLVNERFLQGLLLVILPLTAFYVFRKKDFEIQGGALPRRRTIVLAAVISFVIGGYDGFFGPGAGTFLILLYTGLAKINPRIAAGNAKVVNLASNTAAAALFIINGRALIPLGLTAGVFSIAGAYLGSGLVIRRGARVIRYVIMGVLCLLFAKTGWDMFGGP